MTDHIIRVLLTDIVHGTCLGDNGASGLSSNIFKWLREEMQPELDTFLEAHNHKTSVCIDANGMYDCTLIIFQCIMVLNFHQLSQTQWIPLLDTIHISPMEQPTAQTMLIIVKYHHTSLRFIPQSLSNSMCLVHIRG
jgi:hypothetical protein